MKIKLIKLLTILSFSVELLTEIFAQTDSLKIRNQLNQLTAYTISVNAFTLGQTFFIVNKTLKREISVLCFLLLMPCNIYRMFRKAKDLHY